MGARVARFDHNYKRMNELSKDAVSWLTVGDDAAGQRIDNFLVRAAERRAEEPRLPHPAQRRSAGEQGPRRARHAGSRSATSCACRRCAWPTAGERRAGAVAGAADRCRSCSRTTHLLAVDKPAGLAVHGGSGIAFGVIEQLRAARPDARFLELVHRLDRDTSGVLLLAKKRAALVALHAQLRDGDVDKRYLVLVRGKWRDEMRARARSRCTSSRRGDGERRVRVDDGGPGMRETIFRRRATWPDRDPPLALLEAELETGRTHQIRVHLAHLGFPLAGDDKYGDFAWNRVLAEGRA